MKTYLLGTLWVLLSAAAFGQDVKWGPLLKEKARVTVSDIVRHTPNMTIVLKAKGLGFGFRMSNHQLERFDANFNSTMIVPAKPVFEENSLEIEFAFTSGGQIFMLSSFTNQKLEKKFLFVQKINGQTLSAEGDLKKIAELKYEKKYRTGNFGYDFSRDSSKIFIYANTELRKNEPEKYNLYVLDAEMEEIWHKEVTLPYSESRFQVEDYTVDNDGNVFLLGVKYQERGESKRRGKPNYEYRILGYRQDGADVDEYTASLGDLFLTDMRIDVSPKKDIVCAGFYSEKGTFSVKGTYYLRIDRKSKEIEKISSKEFDIDFITMNFTSGQEQRAKKREAKGKNVELYEYDLRDIIPRADGGAVLLAEQYYVVVVCTYNSKTGQQTCTYHYYYNDVIVVSVNPEGEIEWATKVPKRQHSVNDGGYYSSFATMITSENLYLVYNDHKLNLEVQKQGKYYNYSLGDKNGIVMLATIDPNGEVTRKALFSNEEITTITRPKLCQQVSATEMLLYGKKRKGSQFGVATF
jgi:hypothetical protein